MRSRPVAVMISAMVLYNSPSPAQEAATRYESRYMLSGFLLRSSNVCGDDWKRTVRAAFGFIGTPEFIAMNKGYPQTTAKWMTEGVDNFNNGVMTDGIITACAYAAKLRGEAEAIIKNSAR